MKSLRTLFLLQIAVCLTGCVPYFVFKTILPTAQITVLDDREQPIESAQVLLAGDYNPHGGTRRWEEGPHEIKTTNENGVAVFEARREWQTEMLAVHGVRYYYWHWCIRKPGFKTYVSVQYKFESQAAVRLSRGPSSACPERFP